MLRPIRVVSAALYLSVCSHARVLGYFQSHSRNLRDLTGSPSSFPELSFPLSISMLRQRSDYYGPEHVELLNSATPLPDLDFGLASLLYAHWLLRLRLSLPNTRT